MILQFTKKCAAHSLCEWPPIKRRVRPIYTLLSTLLISSAAILYPGCQNSVDESGKTSSTEAVKRGLERPQLIKVTRSAAQNTDSSPKEQFLFIYVDKEGNEARGMSIDEIPVESRAKVQVIDLSRSPEERGSREYLQIFDLRAPDQNGLYRGRVVKRGEVERTLASEQALPEQAPIILYSTSWCGVCKKARRFMEERGLAFVEKDIEKDRSAARELQEKCERAKVPLGGVPVIDIGGQLMRGFDPNRLLSMLNSK